MQNRLLLLILLGTLGLVHVNAVAGPPAERGIGTGEDAEGLGPGITPGMERRPGRDFLRPEFEHEQQRERAMRDREGLRRGGERAVPQADPGLERAWEGLESERGHEFEQERRQRSRRY